MNTKNIFLSSIGFSSFLIGSLLCYLRQHFALAGDN